MLLFSSLSSFSKDGDFEFGVVTSQELSQTKFPEDTTANAYVMNEFGEAFIVDPTETRLIFNYHVKIKILNKNGLDYANITIPVRKEKDFGLEEIYDLKAFTYNIENGVLVKNELDLSKVYTENVNVYTDLKKFTFPNVKEGSIIEYRYSLKSPFFFNFKKWEFQTDIPKVKSEYWAKIPGTFIYNISLKGFYKLSKNESNVENDCFNYGTAKASCAFFKFAMNNIPAFVEEEYMTAEENFISSINFELMEVKYLTGGGKKFSKEWNDVYLELKSNEDFGLQIKKHKDLFKTELDLLIAKESDKVALAKAIYTNVKDWYKWNGYYGKYADLGLKKSYSSHTGNTADINLALIGAMEYANIDTDPVLVSTRNNGLPTKVYPILSDFNYVIAKINIDDKSFLLDATDRDVPFGLLPLQCLNGEGRAIGRDSCYWVDLTPKKKYKNLNMANLEIQEDGSFTGKIIKYYFDYEALNQRKRIKKFASKDEYIEDLDERLTRLKIKDYKILNLDSIDNVLTEEFTVVIDGFDNLDKDKFLLNPFILDKISENPFKLDERLYPVDFGAPIETKNIVSLKVPENFISSTIPKPLNLAIPNNGGRYLFEVKVNNTNISISENILINKNIYDHTEYPYLKELYNQIVQNNQVSLIFNKVKTQ